MGEYGTPNIDIEEGWLTIKHKNREQRFMYPRQASSLYHTSKIMDTDLLWFYTRMNKIKVTDLMQGPVYGIMNNDFIEANDYQISFAYDDMFGTVLNRFIVQAVAKTPLLVYGSGSQIRGYINIKDTLACISLALENPPALGDMHIHNQFTEQFSVNQLARKVQKSLKKIDINVSINKIKNPSKTILQAIGMNLSENLEENINIKTKRLAKKQITWFKKEDKLKMIESDNEEEVYNSIMEIINV